MLVLVYLEIVLILMQDRCTVCVDCTIDSEIALEALDGSLGDIGHVESRFNPFGDRVLSLRDRCMVCAKRVQKSF
jgi:hypothetical protein